MSDDGISLFGRFIFGLGRYFPRLPTLRRFELKILFRLEMPLVPFVAFADPGATKLTGTYRSEELAGLADVFSPSGV